MSVVNLNSLLNDDITKKLASLFCLEDLSDQCGQCRRLSFLHKDGTCTQKEKESPELVNKIWSDFRVRVKPILTVLKSESKKETEDGHLLEGLKMILVTIYGQNAENLTLKDSLKKRLLLLLLLLPLLRLWQEQLS